jgi:hypothetical protein
MTRFVSRGVADLSINTVYEYEKSQEVASRVEQRNSVEFLAWNELRGKGDSFFQSVSKQRDV